MRWTRGGCFYIFSLFSPLAASSYPSSLPSVWAMSFTSQAFSTFCLQRHKGYRLCTTYRPKSKLLFLPIWNSSPARSSSSLSSGTSSKITYPRTPLNSIPFLCVLEYRLTEVSADLASMICGHVCGFSSSVPISSKALIIWIFRWIARQIASASKHFRSIRSFRSARGLRKWTR